MTVEKKNDGELFSLIWMTVIFGGLVAGISIWYSAWEQMGGLWKYIGYLCLIINAAFIVVIFAKKDDPVYDKYRALFCVFAVGTALFIGGFRFSKNESDMITEDSNAAKQEQIK